MSFEDDAEVVDLVDLVRIQCGDGKAAVRLGFHQALVLKDAKPLSDRDPARLEYAGQVLLPQARTRWQDAVEDRLAKGVEHEFLSSLEAVTVTVDDRAKGTEVAFDARDITRRHVCLRRRISRVSKTIDLVRGGYTGPTPTR